MMLIISTLMTLAFFHNLYGVDARLVVLPKVWWENPTISRRLTESGPMCNDTELMDIDEKMEVVLNGPIVKDNFHPITWDDKRARLLNGGGRNLLRRGAKNGRELSDQDKRELGDCQYLCTNPYCCGWYCPSSRRRLNVFVDYKLFEDTTVRTVNPYQERIDRIRKGLIVNCQELLQSLLNHTAYSSSCLEGLAGSRCDALVDMYYES